MKVDLTVIFGDFNLPGIDWTRDDETLTHAPTNELNELETVVVDSLSAEGFVQVNGFKNCYGRTLDLVLTNDCDDMDILLSDHALSTIDLHHPPL